MQKILSCFAVQSQVVHFARYGSGHINDTYKVVCENGELYIVQRMNTRVFKDPDALMENISRVTRHLAKKMPEPREVLTLIPAKNGEAYARIGEECWRVYVFVKDSLCVNTAQTKEQFSGSAAAFGRFFNALSDFPAEALHETIKDFHNTPVRLEALKTSVRADTEGRVKNALREIDAALSYEKYAHTLIDLQHSGELPLRVTHNDTKINNVLFDKKTGRGLCVIDLDTVMPGLVLNDFGDSIRFGASTAAEDERELDKVGVDLALYEAYLRAYVGTSGRSLTKNELALLPDGAKMMTYECGIRFLADYLSGDRYFHIREKEQNLYRARAQLKLVRDMDEKWARMQSILSTVQKENGAK